MSKYSSQDKEATTAAGATTVGGKRPRGHPYITSEYIGAPRPTSQHPMSYTLFNDPPRPSTDDPKDDETDDESSEHQNSERHHQHDGGGRRGGARTAAASYHLQRSQPSSAFQPGLLTQMANVALVDAEIEFEESPAAAEVHSFSQSADATTASQDQQHLTGSITTPTTSSAKRSQHQLATAQSLVASKLKKFREDNILKLVPTNPKLAEKAFLRQFISLGVGVANDDYTVQLNNL